VPGSSLGLEPFDNFGSTETDRSGSHHDYVVVSPGFCLTSLEKLQAQNLSAPFARHSLIPDPGASPT
jgi:hypothetical protein